MDLNTLLSTVILVSFIVTVVLAVGSYMAYKLRERRKPVTERAGGAAEPVFFERFFPQGKPEAAAGDRAERSA